MSAGFVPNDWAEEQASDEKAQIMRIKECLFRIEQGHATAEDAKKLREFMRDKGIKL